MPTLKKMKHEIIALAYDADIHKIGYLAYQRGYPKAKRASAQANFVRLLKNAEFQARLDELHSVQVAKSIMTRDEVLQETTKLGRANMLDYVRIGKDGTPFIDWTALNRDQAAAIVSVQVEERLERRLDAESGEYENVPVRKVKFTTASKMAALELLAKHHKIVDNSQKVGVTLTLEMLVAASFKTPPLTNGASALNGNGHDKDGVKVIEHQPGDGE